MMLLSRLLLLLFSISAARLTAQYGCTDPQATNYNPGATINDGSCVYPVTNYTLPLKTLLSTTLNETSGLVVANGAVWTHNDSGNQPRIYKIDTLTNSILQTVIVGGATNVDWEDITFDGTHFYIGDFGNNANGNRTDLKIYKFPISAIPAGTTVTVPAGQVGIIHYSYEDQIDFTPQGANNTRFDCESIIYRDGELHLFSKDWIDHYTVHYTLPTTPGTYEALNLETFFPNGLITGADISGPGVILLQGYESSGGPLFFWLLFDYSGGVFFNGNKRRIGLGSWSGAGQTEGVCFRNSAYGYISNERVSASIPARLFSFQVSQWLQPQFLPVELVRFSVRPSPEGALLEWETASEQQNTGFAVERSDDGAAFREIGFVPGAGNSATRQRYRYVDGAPGGTRYYRLRQLDWDGSESLSPQVVLSADTGQLPCPGNALLLSDGQHLITGFTEDATMLLWDDLGRLVWQGRLSQAGFPELNPGVYHIQIGDNGPGRLCARSVVVLR